MKDKGKRLEDDSCEWTEQCRSDWGLRERLEMKEQFMYRGKKIKQKTHAWVSKSKSTIKKS